MASVKKKQALTSMQASNDICDLLIPIIIMIIIMIISNDTYNHIPIRNMHTYSCLKEKMTPKLSFWSAKPLLFGFTIFQ
jgi:hypothetical protein